MFKIALSALIALAVLAPTASAAAPPRPPKVVAENPCADLAAITKPNGAYTVRLTKEQMDRYASLDCSVEEPCPDPEQQRSLEEKWAQMQSTNGGGAWPRWIRPECALTPEGGAGNEGVHATVHPGA